ncbi:hypothetical protein ENUP19_0113G0015 [Entamoeba nuttalli]|uniref:TLDc domain-containing protein n=1 Tax=Entamoeba nuttalli TaxID=412467 RepID=A0ABQ0DI36_9EUKA
MQNHTTLLLYFDSIRVSNRLSAELYLCRVNREIETMILIEYFHISQSHLQELKKAAMNQNNVMTYLDELENDELFQYCMLIKGTQLKNILVEKKKGLFEGKESIIDESLKQAEVNEIKKSIDLNLVLQVVHSLRNTTNQISPCEEQTNSIISKDIKKAIMRLTGTQYCEEIKDFNCFVDKEAFLTELVERNNICILWKEETGEVFGVYIQDEISAEVPLGFDNYVLWVKGEDADLKVLLLNQKFGVDATISFVDDDNWIKITGKNGLNMVFCSNGTNECSLSNIQTSFYIDENHPICSRSSFKISNLYLLHLHH